MIGRAKIWRKFTYLKLNSFKKKLTTFQIVKKLQKMKIYLKFKKNKKFQFVIKKTLKFFSKNFNL